MGDFAEMEIAKDEGSCLFPDKGLFWEKSKALLCDIMSEGGIQHLSLKISGLIVAVKLQ